MVFQGARVQAVKRSIQWSIMERPRGIHVGGLFLSLVQLHAKKELVLNWQACFHLSLCFTHEEILMSKDGR